jgi:ubiquinone/menaquinone biosynthesis C-methylase UbiE
MSELEPQGFDPDSLIVLNHNYLTSHNVRARFELYDFAIPYIDIETEAIAALNLEGRETVVDIGAADGSLLHHLRSRYHHKGRLIGVEPNITQLETSRLEEPLEKSIVLNSLRKAAARLSTNDLRPGFDEKLAAYISSHSKSDINFEVGDANNIPLEKDTADILFAMFMLYHVPEHKQPAAIEEFKRVLRPDGIFVMATSGEDNKPQHRLLENKIADYLGVIAPERMNSSFTTEKAATEIPKHFKHTYIFKQETPMLISDSDRLEKYLDSIWSLRDQFRPVPSIEEFQNGIAKAAIPYILRSIKPNNGVFSDHISRSVIIASDHSMELEPAKFEDISLKN